MALTEAQKEQIRKAATAGIWTWLNRKINRVREYERQLAQGESEESAWALALEKFPSLVRRHS